MVHKALLESVAEKGSRLREVRKDLLRQPNQRWVQGPDGCDLSLWYDEVKGLSQIQLTCERRAVEWSLTEGLRTARLRSFDPLRPLDDQSRLVFDPRPDPEALELARALLGGASVDDVTLALVRRHLRLR